MRLPNAEHAVVDEAKVREYLLSTEHPAGRFKARFFRALGYSAPQWTLLRDALLTHARTGEAESDPVSAYGLRFRIRAILEGPAGRSGVVVSIWLVGATDNRPRFVTAFPGGRP